MDGHQWESLNNFNFRKDSCVSQKRTRSSTTSLASSTIKYYYLELLEYSNQLENHDVAASLTFRSHIVPFQLMMLKRRRIRSGDREVSIWLGMEIFNRQMLVQETSIDHRVTRVTLELELFAA